jgi:hypothetical protein
MCTYFFVFMYKFIKSEIIIMLKVEKNVKISMKIADILLKNNHALTRY